MEITLCIRGQKLEAHYPTLYSGSIGVLYARFAEVDFDKTLIKTVRFKTADSDWYTADITDGAALVPHEVIVDGGFDIALAGYDSEDGELTRFLPTNSVHIDVTENGFGDPDAPLKTEGDFESVIAKLDKMAVKGALSSEDNVFDDLPAGVYHLNAGVTNAPVDWGGTLIVSRSELDERNMVYSDRIFITGDAEYNAEKEGVGFIYQATLYGTAGSELGVDTPWYDVTRKSEIDAEIEKKADLSLVEKLIPKTTVKGETLEITDHLVDVEVVDYKVYGNSVQDGEPTLVTPIEIQSVGDLITDDTDANYGKYDISFASNNIMYHIYLNEPLCKIGDCADYIDFENQQVVRNVQRIVPTISDEIALYSYNYTNGIAFRNVLKEGGTRIIGLCTHSSKVYNTGSMGVVWCGANSNTTIYWIGVLDLLGLTTVDEFKEWMTTQICRFEVICKRITPVYEPVKIAKLTISERNIAHIGTSTEIPGTIELTYYQDINKKLAELQSMIATA